MIGAVSQDTAEAVIAASVIVLGFVALAIVGWIFWRAAKRDREAGRLEDRGAGTRHPAHAGARMTEAVPD